MKYLYCISEHTVRHQLICRIQVQTKTDFNVYAMHANAFCFSPWTKICSVILRYKDHNESVNIITKLFLHNMMNSNWKY